MADRSVRAWLGAVSSNLYVVVRWQALDCPQSARSRIVAPFCRSITGITGSVSVLVIVICESHNPLLWGRRRVRHQDRSRPATIFAGSAMSSLAGRYEIEVIDRAKNPRPAEEA